MKAFDRYRLHLQTANANLLRIIGSYEAVYPELIAPLVLYAESVTHLLEVWEEIEPIYREL